MPHRKTVKNEVSEDMTHTTDIGVPFVLPAYALRGRVVRLQDVTTKILAQHAYPLPVGHALADLLAAGATLGGLLKYEGIFTLQTKGDGPIGLAVVDMTHEGHLRGYAQFNEDILPPEGGFHRLFGRGYLAFTVDQKPTDERYQGIVNLNHTSLSLALEHYFEQSEQLKTRICLFSTQEGDVWKNGALLLQEMPGQKADKDAWDYGEAILQTLLPAEFLDFSIPYTALLTRLFHEADVVIYDPVPLKAQCRCSAERIKNVLSTLTPEEIDELLEKGQLKMTCEFCNHHYTFDRKDLMTVH